MDEVGGYYAGRNFSQGARGQPVCDGVGQDGSPWPTALGDTAIEQFGYVTVHLQRTLFDQGPEVANSESRPTSPTLKE
jgi:hypothetical protein